MVAVINVLSPLPVVQIAGASVLSVAMLVVTIVYRPFRRSWRFVFSICVLCFSLLTTLTNTIQVRFHVGVCW